MSGLSLHVDTDRWRTHQSALLDEQPGLVPVAKGNGYGFGVTRLAMEAQRLGVDTLAVGDCADARRVLDRFGGRIVVLAPTAAGGRPDDLPARVVLHVTSAAHRMPATGRGLVIALSSPLRCRGVVPGELAAVLTAAGSRPIAGFSIHLPIRRRRGDGHASVVATWIERLRHAGVAGTSIFVSHLSTAELETLAARFPAFAVRPTIGTNLWLGDRDALGAFGTVLDVLAIRRGERFGYHQRRALRGGQLVVVAGGTAHGIGLSAPRVPVGVRARTRSLLAAGATALSRDLSPFRWRGRRLWFAEPPHMLTSVLLLPGGRPVPAIGAELEARVRYTTTSFDAVVERV